jgi:hypothetical protein
MLKIKIVIGDVEYDTGSFISNLPRTIEDWESVEHAVEAYLDERTFDKDSDEFDVDGDDDFEEEDNG